MPNGGSSVSRTFRHRILVADGDEALLTTTAEMLSREGYEVITAKGGFEALAALRVGEPNILISELRMADMSGFELLAVVRKRFPAMGVIVVSGEFAPLAMPEGVLADRFLQKGENSPFELLEIVRELLTESPLRPQPARTDVAPAWLPRTATGYVVLTCPMCLRSYSVPARHVALGVLLHDTCMHCGANISYRIDSTGGIASPPSRMEKSKQLRESSRHAIDESQKAIEESRRRRLPKR